jgi:hypothetical protein
MQKSLHRPGQKTGPSAGRIYGPREELEGLAAPDAVRVADINHGGMLIACIQKIYLRDAFLLEKI